MPNPSRLAGRFSCFLISLSFAVLLPRTAVASEAVSPAASLPEVAWLHSGHFSAWPTARRFTSADELLAAPVAASNPRNSGSGLTLCQIIDTVYRADGNPAQGTIVILWPAFTTADGQPVAPGTLAVQLGPNGAFNASLAPNSGAMPAGTYYRATYKLNDGTTNTEYWVVPATQTTTIGAIRSKLVPANQAAQFLTRDFADSHYMNLSADQTVAGVKTFSSSPAVPTPHNPADAANKAYVDSGGGGGGGDLSSPPPIGDVTPNTGNFTTLTVQSLNGVPNPANYPESDPCARINAAIDALPPEGGTVDARSFAPGQVCNASVNANKPVTLVFGAGTWSFNGDPGINVSAPNVVIACPASAILQRSPTILMSGGPYALISNTVDPASYGLHSADGSSVTGCELNGNGTGTFGIFAPGSYSMKIHGVHAAGFTAADILVLAGQYDIQNTVADGSGGDGLLLGYDGHVSGMSQSNGNTADGWHVVSGGNVFDGPTGYRNGLYGMHFDGNQGGDWLATATYLEPKIIIPTSNNSGSYAYYTQQVGTTGSARPATFCQTIGCVVRDGTVRWVNIGTLNGYGFGVPEVFLHGLNNINSPNISQSNFGDHAGDWDNILIEGSATRYSIGNSVIGAKVRQSEVPSTPAHGLHLKFASITSLKDTEWQGGAYAASPQVELGGMEIESSYFTEIGFLNCLRSYGNCLSLVTAFESTIDKLVGQDGGVSGDATTYAVAMDANSDSTIIDKLLVADDRDTPYQRGISNASAAGHLVVKNRKYIGITSPDSGNMYVDEALGDTGSLLYNLPLGARYQWSVNGIASIAFDERGLRWFSASDANNNVTLGAASAPFSAYSMTLPTTPGAAGQCLTSAGGGAAPMIWSTCSNVTLGSPPPIGNVAPNTVNATALTYQNIPGVEYLASRYASMQAAIDAAYNNGSVQGTVVDDRTSGYIGPGFVVPDSVTVKLAAVQYTFTSAASFNNGNNVVTAGIVLREGAHLLGAGNSTNHGTVLNVSTGANFDVVATSSVGTGIAATAQWWHWGEIGNLQINGANQTAGECLKIENMGEAASVHDLLLKNCYANNLELIGAFASQSKIENITSNRSQHGSGVRTTNLAGVVKIVGLSGDCNPQNLVSTQQSTAGSLTIVGLKSEAESSICPINAHDPVVLIDGVVDVIAHVQVIGGYAFGTAQTNFIKAVSAGTFSVETSGMYLVGYTNIFTDSVRTISIPATAGNNKQPFVYEPNGTTYSNQAFTLTSDTFVEGMNGSGLTTEIFGNASDGATAVAALGNGDDTGFFTGGIRFGIPNRAMYGQSPEFMARMGSHWLNPGYDVNTWTFIPIWGEGDSGPRWIGDPNARWNEVYAADVNSTTATVGTLNVTTCNGCGTGMRLVSGTMQGATGNLTGNSTDQTIYSATLPAGTFRTGAGAHCFAKWTHPTASGAITYKWTLGTTTWAYSGYTSSSQNIAADIEILTISSLSSESVNLSPVIAGTVIGIGGSYGNSGSENLANADTIKLTFNGGSSDQIKGATFYCQTVQ